MVKASVSTGHYGGTPGRIFIREGAGVVILLRNRADGTGALTLRPERPAIGPAPVALAAAPIAKVTLPSLVTTPDRRAAGMTKTIRPAGSGSPTPTPTPETSTS